MAEGPRETVKGSTGDLFTGSSDGSIKDSSKSELLEGSKLRRGSVWEASYFGNRLTIETE